jgi:hypothetical protein
VTIAEGHWQSAAGQLLKGELIKRGTACETSEELGITNPEEDLDLVRALRQLDPDDGRERIQLFYCPAASSGEITNREPDKCQKLAFWSIPLA